MVRLAGPFHNFCSQIPSAFLNFTNLLISLISLICFQYMPTECMLTYALPMPISRAQCTNAYRYSYTISTLCPPICPPICPHYAWQGCHPRPQTSPPRGVSAKTPAVLVPVAQQPCLARFGCKKARTQHLFALNCRYVARSLSYKLQTVELLYWPICGDSVAFVCVRSKR